MDMRVYLAPALIAALLSSAVAVGQANAAAAATAPGKGDEAWHVVDVGAVTFSMELPQHTQYVVTKISVEFLEASDARHYGEAGNLVRLRDAILTALVDTRPPFGRSEIDSQVLQSNLKHTLSKRVPSLHSVNVAILGQRSVPRR